ncbi:MAG: hypothetical protein K2H19_03040 [Ruminococcus sp.]|nr:hypothetical protein [Ruminococcus sp.]
MPRKDKKNPEEIKLQKPKKSLFNRGLFKIVAVSLVVGCTVLVITTEQDCKDKERELTVIQSKIDEYNIRNEDLKRTLESDDLSAYMTKVALEERGYAYPDERRFYDTSRD